MKLKLYDDWIEEAEKKNIKIITDIEHPSNDGCFVNKLSKKKIKQIIRMISKAYVYIEAIDLIKGKEKSYKVYIVDNKDLDKILKMDIDIKNKARHKFW